MPYLLCFTSHGADLQEGAQRRVLACLEGVARVFPLEMQLSEGVSKILRSPADLDRSAVPGIYRIDDANFRIPLLSRHRGLEVVFVESNEPSRFPAQIHVTTEGIEESGLWPLERLIDVIACVVDAVPLDNVFVCDEQQLDQEVYADRTCRLDLSAVPLGVFWVNFFSSTLLANIGERAEKAIGRQAPVTRSLRSGLIFATQEGPFRAGMAEDESRLASLESILDYRLYEHKFPLVY